MNRNVLKAIELVKNYPLYLCRKISPNDSGTTTSNQAGVYVDKLKGKLLFDKPVKKGENTDQLIKIEWADSGLNHECRFVFYGKAKKNEFRLTRLSRKFVIDSFLILVMVDKEENNFIGFVLDESEGNFFLK